MAKATQSKKIVLNAEQVRLQTLVKRANQRLRQLEASGIKNSSAYKHIQALSRSGSQLYTTDSKGRFKFRTDIGHINKSQLYNMEQVVNRFLERKTSTVKGVKETNYKAYQTFTDNHPELDISYDDFQIMWNREILKSKSALWSSEILFDVVGSMLKDTHTDEETGEQVKNFADITQVLDFISENNKQDIDYFREGDYYSANPWENTI